MFIAFRATGFRKVMDDMDEDEIEQLQRLPDLAGGQIDEEDLGDIEDIQHIDVEVQP
ncbi:hypothetical protein SAMN04489802_2790 [Pseudomonas chlororaphis]|uniref:hypothetical protein n=1 Tax=Pseudomonas chlororaphis TaxID=587753 RepID=UPI00087CB888|nr:hypothetical protein [Pseudomonas chlororaphis]AZD67623.1 hypothetical protein C4K17_3737 [Pseudomonas chlororaphis subsp. aurantiaca]QIT23595.1 hypothetical protein HCN09_18295 [Pseudomonas chlororaphis subsp. aurantiaca]WDH01689.1 hypothetical protein PUP57_19420 [Pseudomonas chlororaphis]WDH09463.1 hypothetical protein PUP64_27590 [Pseudomonas chlororaphis]SDS96901.1 hypothetical protein SAMN04489802_2790 [Pseudomonas chlororaphis]